MQVVVWIIIILVVIFLIWLLRRWIRRIIFIVILLVLAFFIYGIFNPSGAARVWYNVRTFPQRMAGWMGSTKEFLDYDSYKSKISSIGDSIGDKVESLGNGIENLGDKIDIDITPSEDEKEIEIKDEKNDEKDIEKNTENEDSSQASDEQTIKSFPKSVDFVKMPELGKENKQESKTENNGVLTGYSKSDLLGVINKYIEKNLDDDTDILVTVEYEDDSNGPQKIILQTQQKGTGQRHSVAMSGDLLDSLFSGNEVRKSEDENIVLDSKVSSGNSNNEEKNSVKPVQKTKSTGLTQQDKKEAAEISSILF